MDLVQKLIKESFDIKNDITQPALVDELHKQLTRTVSVIYLTSTNIFLNNCSIETKSYISILMDLAADIKEIYQALHQKPLHLTNVSAHHRLYHINTKTSALSLYFMLCEKVNQSISFTMIGIDHLFLDQKDAHKLNLMLTVRECLIQAYNFLEISLVKFPNLYTEKTPANCAE